MGNCIWILLGHSSFVNAIHPARRGPPLLCSASDDCNIKVWDPRKRTETVSLDNSYQVASVTFNDTAEQVISAGIDNDVKVRIILRQVLHPKIIILADTCHSFWHGLSFIPSWVFVCDIYHYIWAWKVEQSFVGGVKNFYSSCPWANYLWFVDRW